MTKFERISIHIKALIDSNERDKGRKTRFSEGILVCLHLLDMECDLLELGKSPFDYETMKKELEEKKNGKRD